MHPTVSRWHSQGQATAAEKRPAGNAFLIHTSLNNSSLTQLGSDRSFADPTSDTNQLLQPSDRSHCPGISMEEEGEGSSYITTSSLIDAQFHDLIQPEKESESSSTAGSRSKATQKKQSKDRSDASVPSDDEENQDWEWVDETQYIILDFGGNNLDARDMEKMLDKGINLVVCSSLPFRCSL
jgi:hypothetical protein